jgi:predicted nucleotidyltransferase
MSQGGARIVESSSLGQPAKRLEVVTLAGLKHARVEEIRAGYARLCEDLAHFAHANGGRFWVYGSAVSGRFHADSDIDIIADFDDAQIGEALDMVEAACARLRLKPDIQPKAWCTKQFLAKIHATALLLP